MFKVIETAGQDEPWWFFDDWEKMIVSTEEFSSLEEAKNSFQQHEARLASNYPEKRSKGTSAIAFWDEKEMCIRDSYWRLRQTSSFVPSIKVSKNLKKLSRYSITM